MRVSCYTNQPEAELFLNGRSLGKKSLAEGDGWRVTWEVPFAAGELRVSACGAEDALVTSGPAEALRLLPDLNGCLPADGQTVVQIEISLLDANGRAAARDEIVHCDLTGDGAILGIENGIPDDLTPYAERFRSTNGGLAIAYIRVGETPGDLTLTAWTKSGLRSSVVFRLWDPEAGAGKTE